MKPLALLLHLRLNTPKAGLRTHPVPVRGGQLQGQLLIPPLGNSEGLAGPRVKVIREPRLISSILHPLFDNENLLDGLRKSNKNTP